MYAHQVRAECFYCGSLIRAEHGVGDHFPIPEKAGGTETVPCCQSCHDMKDIFALKNWPIGWMEPILRDMPKFSRETKILLAKIMALASFHIDNTKQINHE